MMKRSKRLVSSAVLMLGAVGLAPAAFAQTAQSQQQPPAAQQPPANQQNAPAMKPSTGPKPSNTELKHFVNAALDVQKIGQQVQPQLKQAKSNADRMKLQQQAEAKMKAAVQRHHLSVTRYQQIFVSMRTDNGVKQKVQKLVQEKQGK